MSQSAWVYVECRDGQPPKISKASETGITVKKIVDCDYVVDFPLGIKKLTCVATHNTTTGQITAVPGGSSGLLPNQVFVLTATPASDFSLLVFYKG